MLKTPSEAILFIIGIDKENEKRFIFVRRIRGRGNNHCYRHYYFLINTQLGHYFYRMLLVGADYL